MYGRFTNMSRAEVIEYLESWGFACYDNESTNDLRYSAYENEKCETDPSST